MFIQKREMLPKRRRSVKGGSQGRRGNIPSRDKRTQKVFSPDGGSRQKAGGGLNLSTEVEGRNGRGTIIMKEERI